MAKYRVIKCTILIVGICVIFILVTLFFILKGNFAKVVNIADKAESLIIDDEKNFLSRVQAALNHCVNCKTLDSKISERIRQLQTDKNDILSESDIQKFISFSFTGPQREGMKLRDQIQFLMRAKKVLTNCPKCGAIKTEIAEKIVALRMRLPSIIVIRIKDNVRSLVKKPPIRFYLPTDAINAVEICWHSDGMAIIYEVQRKYPGNSLVDEFSQHYDNLSWKPLKYDLSQALELGGLQGGWRKGPGMLYFWTQFWVDQNKQVINVNVSYYDQNKARIVIVSPNKQQIESALEYYYKIHGALDTEPNEQIVEKIIEDGYNFFAMRPI